MGDAGMENGAIVPESTKLTSRQWSTLARLADARARARPFDALTIGLSPVEVAVPRPADFTAYAEVLSEAQNVLTDAATMGFLRREHDWLDVDWASRLRRALGQVLMAERLGLRPPSAVFDWAPWLRSDLIGDELAARASTSETVGGLNRAVWPGAARKPAGPPSPTALDAADEEFAAAGACYCAIEPWVELDVVSLPGDGDLRELHATYAQWCEQWCVEHDLPAPTPARLRGIAARIDGVHIAARYKESALMLVDERALEARVGSLDAYQVAGLLTLLAHEGWPGHAWEFASMSGAASPLRLLRDPALSEGWACLAEFYPALCYGPAVVKRAAEAVMRRCAALMASARGAEAVTALASRYIESDHLPRFLGTVARTAGQSEHYALGLRRWRDRLHVQYGDAWDWGGMLRAAGRRDAWSDGSAPPTVARADVP